MRNKASRPTDAHKDDKTLEGYLEIAKNAERAGTNFFRRLSNSSAGKTIVKQISSSIFSDPTRTTDENVELARTKRATELERRSTVRFSQHGDPNAAVESASAGENVEDLAETKRSIWFLPGSTWSLSILHPHTTR